MKKTLNESQALPDHVLRFEEISQRLDQAVLTKNKEETGKITQELEIFYGTLTDKQLAEIRRYLEQQNAGIRVAQHRNYFHRTIGTILQAPAIIGHNAVDSVSALARETGVLISGVFFGGIRGLQKGYEKYWQAA